MLLRKKMIICKYIFFIFAFSHTTRSHAACYICYIKNWSTLLVLVAVNILPRFSGILQLYILYIFLFWSFQFRIESGSDPCDPVLCPQHCCSRKKFIIQRQQIFQRGKMFTRDKILHCWKFPPRGHFITWRFTESRSVCLISLNFSFILFLFNLISSHTELRIINWK